MPQLRFNHVFFALMVLGLMSSLVISPAITDRAKGKEELLLLPVVKPVRGLARWMHSKWGSEPSPPGESKRSDATVAMENQELRQQVAYLTQQLDALQLVQAERKRLGKLLDHFEPARVIGGDGTPERESLSIMPVAGGAGAVDTPVMCADGLVGKMFDGRRIRLTTDKESVMTGEFGRFEGPNWRSLTTPKASVRGIGAGKMRVDHLTVKEAGEIKPGDWVVAVGDSSWPDVEARKVVAGRQIGQVETVRPLASKPMYAEIIIRPRVELKRLKEVYVMKSMDRGRPGN